MQKVLIANATNPANIGDLAMLQSLRRLIYLSLPSSDMIIHSYNPGLYSKTFGAPVKHTIYDWIAFENRHNFIRLWRLISFISVYLYNRVGLNRYRNSFLQELICDYKAATLIIFAPGGYLRTRKGITQTLNLLMQLAHFKVGELTKARRIVAPISFGPFAHRWQERLAAKTLRETELVMLREQYSYDLLDKYKLKNIIRCDDMALLTLPAEINKDILPTIGYTVRGWLSAAAQDYLEVAIVNALSAFAEDFRVRLQPIVQVDAPEFGDIDLIITERITQRLIEKGVTPLETIRLTGVDHALQTYGELDLLLGMRMHSNILAAVQRVPFVAISYEHKTEGIAEQLGVGDYCIKCEDVNEEKLSALLVKAYNDREHLGNVIKENIEKIQSREIKRWTKLLQHL